MSKGAHIDKTQKSFSFFFEMEFFLLILNKDKQSSSILVVSKPVLDGLFEAQVGYDAEEHQPLYIYLL
jgi:hypothetical protein